MKPNILVICGPTASGKTALAAELALRFGGEVVSADSMQVYRRMDIGTAKPTQSEQRGVPHHMIDVAEPEENYSVARYVADAVPIVDGILARGKLPIIAGGTGLYIDHLVAGRQFAPFQPDSGLRPQLQARAREEGLPALYAQLAQVDPDAAGSIHPNDEKRIIRALEVPARPGEPRPAQPLYAADHRPELCPTPPPVGAHRPPGGPDDGPGAGGGGPRPAGIGHPAGLHRHAGHRL